MRHRIATVGLVLGLLLATVAILSVPAAASEVTVQSTNRQVTITLTILNAEYTDADDDGLQDDVVAYFDISLSGKERYSLELTLSLTLPSDNEYAYTYLVNTRLSMLHCTIYFYNHATEQGDYVFHAHIVSHVGGVVDGSAQYEFDPPGGSGDADPCAALVVEA